MARVARVSEGLGGLIRKSSSPSEVISPLPTTLKRTILTQGLATSSRAEARPRTAFSRRRIAGSRCWSLPRKSIRLVAFFVKRLLRDRLAILNRNYQSEQFISFDPARRTDDRSCRCNPTCLVSISPHTSHSSSWQRHSSTSSSTDGIGPCLPRLFTCQSSSGSVFLAHRMSEL